MDSKLYQSLCEDCQKVLADAGEVPEEVDEMEEGMEEMPEKGKPAVKISIKPVKNFDEAEDRGLKRMKG